MKWHVLGFMALTVAYGIVCFDGNYYVSQNFGFLGCLGVGDGFWIEILLDTVLNGVFLWLFVNRSKKICWYIAEISGINQESLLSNMF